MKGKFVVAGSAVVDRIIPYNRPDQITERLGGGVVYALSGAKIWTDDCIAACYTGQDFDRYYGSWMRENDFSFSGINRKFPHTNSGDVRYDADGLYTCTDNYPEYFHFGDMPDEALLKPLMGGSCGAVHLLAPGDLENFASLDKYRSKYGIQVGLEMEPVCRGGAPEDVVQELTDRYLDFFSINFSECKLIYPGIRDEKDALERMQALNCPVFFRMGQKGAYMIVDHKPYFSPLVDDFGTVDPTGCGNSSTAAAFWALCSGYSPIEISYIGAVTAALNASSMGVIPKFEPWMREKCTQLVKNYVGNCRK